MEDVEFLDFPASDFNLDNSEFSDILDSLMNLETEPRDDFSSAIPWLQDPIPSANQIRNNSVFLPNQWQIERPSWNEPRYNQFISNENRQTKQSGPVYNNIFYNCNHFTNISQSLNGMEEGKNQVNQVNIIQQATELAKINNRLNPGLLRYSPQFYEQQVGGVPRMGYPQSGMGQQNYGVIQGPQDQYYGQRVGMDAGRPRRGRPASVLPRTYLVSDQKLPKFDIRTTPTPAPYRNPPLTLPYDRSFPNYSLLNDPETYQLYQSNYPQPHEVQYVRSELLQGCLPLRRARKRKFDQPFLRPTTLNDVPIVIHDDLSETSRTKQLFLESKVESDKLDDLTNDVINTLETLYKKSNYQYAPREEGTWGCGGLEEN